MLSLVYPTMIYVAVASASEWMVMENGRRLAENRSAERSRSMPSERDQRDLRVSPDQSDLGKPIGSSKSELNTVGGGICEPRRFA